MRPEWIAVADELPAKRRDSSHSAFVLVWIEGENGLGFWAGDRFDYSNHIWEVHGGHEGLRITHWMRGPDSPRKPS